MKTSLGIWALGPMVTRFVPGGYKPQRAGETTVERVRRAVEGLGDLIDGYEFHYPQELSEGNLDEVRDALDGHDIYCLATGLHLDPRFGRGGLVSPDEATRAEALRRTLAAIDFAGELGAHFIIWPGIEGYNYPFQTPYRESWAWFVEGIGQAAERCRERGILLFLEHKNSEPAMKILMRNVGMTLHVIHKLRAQGLDNIKVNMDWQHLLMNGESLAEYAAMLASEGVLGHQHANSGWGTFDDDNMVGALAFERSRSWRRSSSPSSSVVPATARTANGSASICTRIRRMQWRPHGAACCSGALSTPPRRGSTTPRCERRRGKRTPSPRTSSSTRHSAGDAARRSRRRHDGCQGARAFARR